MREEWKDKRYSACNRWSGENRRKHPCCLGMCPASVSLHFIPCQESLQRSAPDLRVTCMAVLFCVVIGLWERCVPRNVFSSTNQIQLGILRWFSGESAVPTSLEMLPMVRCYGFLLLNESCHQTSEFLILSSDSSIVWSPVI